MSARRLYRIEWLDHCSHGDDWMRPKSVSSKPCANSTVGWKIAEDRECVTLSSSITAMGDPAEEMVVHSMTILKRNITKRERLG